MRERTGDGEDLRRLIDLVVPADAFPSAAEAGGLGFLDGYLSERPDLRPRLDVLLRADDPTTHPEWHWFAGLVNGGFYADPANGGNRGGESGGWSTGPRSRPPGGRGRCRWRRRC